MIIDVILIIVFLVASAFFSASETALFSLSDLRLRRLHDSSPKAKQVKTLLKRPTHLLSTIVFGNLLVNIGLSSLITAVFVLTFGQRWLPIAVLCSGCLILIFGEIFPKTGAIYFAERLSLLSAPLLTILSKLLYPITFIIEKTVSLLSSFLIRGSQKSSFNDAELRTALLLGRKEGHISEQEEEMISYVLEFKDTWVSEILTARVEIKGIDEELSQEEALTFLEESKHSKLPVYKDSLDTIIGILHAKDCFLNPDKDYHDLMRTPIFIPESKRIDDLLQLFFERQERIAIVLDEYGGTQGLVTLEDIEEEIFGEIYDEFETPKAFIQEVDQGLWRVSGKTPMKTLNLELDLQLPEEEDTLAGFLLAKMEKIPKTGETFTLDTIEFTIERATARRIVNVLLKILPQDHKEH